MKNLKKKFWVALVLFGLIGQVAWTVENMYLNVFLYKMFHASAAEISFMVSASAVAATLTTILIGALTDRVGKRKIFILASIVTVFYGRLYDKVGFQKSVIPCMGMLMSGYVIFRKSEIKRG